MKPIKNKFTNAVLKPAPGTEDRVIDLPVTEAEYTVESCWKMTWQERLKVLYTGQVWFSCWGNTHPPIRLTVRDKVREIK